MYRMKGDMAGGATVLAVMKIISKLNQPSMSSGSYRRSRTFPVHARRSRGMSTANLGFISTSPARPGRPTPRRTGDAGPTGVTVRTLAELAMQMGRGIPHATQ